MSHADMPNVRKRLVRSIAFLASISVGCANTPPQRYVHEPHALPLEKYSSLERPQIIVRSATPPEAELISDFPGKRKLEASASADTAGQIGVIALTWPFWLFLGGAVLLDSTTTKSGRQEASKSRHEAERRQEALDRFASSLKSSLEQNLGVDGSEGPDQQLEIVYVAAFSGVGLVADGPCFVVHSQVTFRSKGVVLYNDSLHMDPRVIEDGLAPSCHKSPEMVDEIASSALPEVIRRRLPGLPWKAPPTTDMFTPQGRLRLHN